MRHFLLFLTVGFCLLALTYGSPSVFRQKRQNCSCPSGWLPRWGTETSRCLCFMTYGAQGCPPGYSEEYGFKVRETFCAPGYSRYVKILY